MHQTGCFLTRYSPKTFAPSLTNVYTQVFSRHVAQAPAGTQLVKCSSAKSLGGCSQPQRKLPLLSCPASISGQFCWAGLSTKQSLPHHPASQWPEHSPVKRKVLAYLQPTNNHCHLSQAQNQVSSAPLSHPSAEEKGPQPQFLLCACTLLPQLSFSPDYHRQPPEEGCILLRARL